MTLAISDQLLLLGYPVNRISKEVLEETMLKLIEGYVKDRRTRYATTVTAQFLGQLAGLSLNHRIAPEIVATLRQADFIGIDSKELQVLVKLLGNTIEDVIHPEDLLLSTSSLLGKYHQSIYILGVKEELCVEASKRLVEDFPGLVISGISCTPIFTKGLELEESIQMDEVIIDAINEAAPTVLALHLGHPKQEIWLERVRTRLKVPLIIGVGGGFERYLARREGSVPLSLSPSWTSIKRKLWSLLHYSLWIPPLLFYNSFNRLIYDLIYQKVKNPSGHPHLFLSSKESLFILPLPALIDRHTWEQHMNWIEAALEHENLIIDFSHVRHMNLEGMGVIYGIFQKIIQANKNLFLIGVNGDVRLLLKLHGAWDWISFFVVEGPADVLRKMSINRGENLFKTKEFLSIDQLNEQTILSFFGRIQSCADTIPGGSQLNSVIQDRHLIINLQYCTSITNSGFGLLLNLRKYQKEQKKSLMIKSVTPVVKNQFKYFKVDSHFNFI